MPYLGPDLLLLLSRRAAFASSCTPLSHPRAHPPRQIKLRIKLRIKIRARVFWRAFGLSGCRRCWLAVRRDALVWRQRSTACGWSTCISDMRSRFRCWAPPNRRDQGNGIARDRLCLLRLAGTACGAQHAQAPQHKLRDLFVLWPVSGLDRRLPRSVDMGAHGRAFGRAVTPDHRAADRAADSVA